MSNVEMRCPNCGMTYALTPEQAPQYVGQTITCTKCQRPFVANVPGYASAAQALPPAPPPVASYASAAGGAYGEPQKSNGLALASLIVGILGFCVPLLGVLAIILGALGMKKTRDPRVGGKGLAIAGLVVGIVATMFVVLQISILLPALNRAREQGNRVKCASNLRQIGLAAQMWANDHRGAYPPDIQALVDAGELTFDVYVCPSSPHDRAPAGTTSLTLGKDLSYVYVGKGLTTQAPPNAIIAYEPPEVHTPGVTGARTGGNVLFADGHVEFVLDLASVIAELKAGHNPPRPPGQRP